MGFPMPGNTCQHVPTGIIFYWTRCAGSWQKYFIIQHCYMCGIQLTEEARNYQENWKKTVGSNPDFMIGLLTEINQEMDQAKQEGGS